MSVIVILKKCILFSFFIYVLAFDNVHNILYPKYNKNKLIITHSKYISIQNCNANEECVLEDLKKRICGEVNKILENCVPSYSKYMESMTIIQLQRLHEIEELERAYLKYKQKLKYIYNNTTNDTKSEKQNK